MTSFYRIFFIVRYGIRFVFFAKVSGQCGQEKDNEKEYDEMKIKFIALLLCCLTMISTAPAQTIIKTPEEAAQGLYRAWSKKNRKTARNFAGEEIVKKLFDTRRQTMKFKGCTKREEGDFECRYEDSKNDLRLAMIVKFFRAGARVTSVSFSSEAV
jgi:hypothetical protein